MELSDEDYEGTSVSQKVNRGEVCGVSFCQTFIAAASPVWAKLHGYTIFVSENTG